MSSFFACYFCIYIWFSLLFKFVCLSSVLNSNPVTDSPLEVGLEYNRYLDNDDDDNDHNNDDSNDDEDNDRNNDEDNYRNDDKDNYYSDKTKK